MFAPNSIKGFESTIEGDMIHREIRESIKRIKNQKDKYRDKKEKVKEKKNKLNGIEDTMEKRLNNLDDAENKFKDIIGG